MATSVGTALTFPSTKGAIGMLQKIKTTQLLDNSLHLQKRDDAYSRTSVPYGHLHTNGNANFSVVLHSELKETDAICVDADSHYSFDAFSKGHAEK